MHTSRNVRIAVVVVSVLCARAVRAQTLPGQGSETSVPVTAGFDNGFFVQGGGGDYRFVVGLTAQIDGRFGLNEDVPITDTFTIRKLRPTFTGRVARYFEFKVMPDFGNGTAVLQDAYVDTRFTNAFRVRVGKDKTPIGYEILMGDPNLFFAERSLASSLVPNRDVGIQAVGDIGGGRLVYSGGVFNGVADAASSVSDVDTNGAKDVAGRITVQPWRKAGAQTSAVSGLGFHLGASIGDQDGPLPSFRTSVGQTYFSYASGVTAAGRRTRVAPAGFYFYGPFGAFGEYTLSTQAIDRFGIARDVSNHAVNVTTTVYLTGEPATTGVTRPRRPFDPASGQWGAVQVLARYSHLELDGDIFVNGLAAAGASRRADQWTVGANWFPTAFTKWYVNYEHTTFDENVAGARPVEHVIVFRAQLAF